IRVAASPTSSIALAGFRFVARAAFIADRRTAAKALVRSRRPCFPRWARPLFFTRRSSALRAAVAAESGRGAAAPSPERSRPLARPAPLAAPKRAWMVARRDAQTSLGLAVGPGPRRAEAPGDQTTAATSNAAVNLRVQSWTPRCGMNHRSAMG